MIPVRKETKEMHPTIVLVLPRGISQVEKQGWEEPKQPAGLGAFRSDIGEYELSRICEAKQER